MEEKAKNRIGKVLLYSGWLMVAVAFGLFCYNLWDDSRAEEEARNVVQQLNMLIWADEQSAASAEQPVEQALVYEGDADRDMPTREIEGNEYVGRIDIPALGLSLPVMSELSSAKLKVAPCRFEGSAYQDNMIIVAENYKTQFGNLRTLDIGSRVVFTDMDGNHFFYQVAEIEELDADDVDKMEEGDWDLTLFTCTLGGISRLTVRCREIL